MLYAWRCPACDSMNIVGGGPKAKNILGDPNYISDLNRFGCNKCNYVPYPEDLQIMAIKIKRV
jgi:hypothetical protein